MAWPNSPIHCGSFAGSSLHQEPSSRTLMMTISMPQTTWSTCYKVHDVHSWDCHGERTVEKAKSTCNDLVLFQSRVKGYLKLLICIVAHARGCVLHEGLVGQGDMQKLQRHLQFSVRSASRTCCMAVFSLWIRINMGVSQYKNPPKMLGLLLKVIKITVDVLGAPPF